MTWLDDDWWEMDASRHVKEWGATFWGLWKIYHKGKLPGPWLTRVPKEVLDMDCWKPWKPPSVPRP